MTLVFQYGSNLSSQRLNGEDRLRGDARVCAVAQTINDYELIFDIWSRINGWAAADILEGRGRKIWGVIYEIPDFLIRRETAGARKSLDAIEGEGSNYQRTEISLNDCNGKLIAGPVITYIGQDRRERITTTADYVKHIITGMREHSLPEEYQRYVFSRIRENNLSLSPMLQ